MINNSVSMYVLLQCILFQYFMNAHVHGAGFPGGLGHVSILFAGRKVGDAIVWYHSSCYNMGLNGAMKDGVTEVGFLSA